MTVTATFWPKGICNRRSHGLKLKLAPLLGYFSNSNVHRNRDRRKVSKDSKPSIGKIEGWSVHAMARCNCIIPRFSDRGAAEYICEHTGQTVSHSDKDKDPDGDMEVPAGEDAKVEY